MDDLVSQIVEKTGVTTQQAKDGVGIAVGWIKERLPDEVVDQVGSALDSAGGMASEAVGKAVEAGSSAGSVAGSAASSGIEAAGSVWDKVKDTASVVLPGDE